MSFDSEMEFRRRPGAPTAATYRPADPKDLPSSARTGRRANLAGDLSCGPAPHFGPGQEIDLNGKASLAILMSGWACEMRILPNGQRQIFSFLLPGDAVLVSQGEATASVTLMALTRVDFGGSPSDAGHGPVARDQQRLQALLDQRARLLNHIVRLGSLNAQARTAHLLLDLFDRLSKVRLTTETSFRLPLTQELFAEALGLSVVHVNRSLGALRRQGLITLRSGQVTIPHPERLAQVAAPLRAA